MCGIAGIINADRSKVNTAVLKNMTDALAHRGPDGEGHWISEDGRTGLGHRRLSIIDLSDAGCEPMHYLDRYTIIFNGEIYNYIELRNQLLQQGYIFKSKTDTEVLVAMYHLKKEECLADLDGMFSFVIYDNETKQLFCARDRFGEKPFFYSYKSGEYFLFGSEMKALWRADIPKTVNNRMLYNYLANGFVENPGEPSETFYKGCIRLPQSHYMVIDTATCTISSIKKYWDIDFRQQDNSITVEDAAERFRSLFYTSVDRRLRSDVPVGSSLSGGLDSSLVVCEMHEILKKQTGSIQKTFSARFKDDVKDEGKYMQMVINKTNAKAHFVFPSDEDLIADIDKVMYHQEEPFASSSIYAQYRVMELAKKNGVTVLLDGQGADEILAGYHYFFIPFFTELKKKHPSEYKKEYSAYRSLHSSNTINPVIKKDLKYLMKSTWPGIIEPVKKIRQLYKQQLHPFFTKEFYHEYRQSDFAMEKKFEGLNHALYFNSLQNGLHQLLRYADRNSMAHGREVRLPFLYHELVSFLFSLPSNFKIRNGWTKWIMREAFKDLIPPGICWRTDKIGFETPQKSWMERDVMKQRILASKKILVDQKLVHVNVLDEKRSNGISKNKNWEQLMAAGCFINI